MGVRSGFRYLIEWWNRWERVLGTCSLVVGFVFDLFLAKRPDNALDNILLISYLFIAAAIIIILNLHMYRRQEEEPRSAPLLLLLILQFCFGGLASNLLVLYGKSGTFADSALFIIILFGMLVGNEFLKSRYAQLRFNIVVYYILLLTYCIIAVPTFLLHSVGTLVFLVSGVLSIGVIAIFLGLVYFLVFRGRNRVQHIYEVSVLVAIAFIFFNGLYFLNIIPPVPLSIKSIGVYHSVTKTAPGVYAGKYETSPWYIFWRDTSDKYTVTGVTQATCFSSVFAPTGLSAPVFHRWEKYDEATKSWMTQSRLSFPINGGRDEGFRGWTIAVVSAGRWRCDVETEGGALIGRISFDVVETPTPAAIATKTL
jgi:hypothetical protein